MKCEILFEDKEMIVIRKPAGLATQSAGVGSPDAVSELKGHLAAAKESLYLGVVHRLDQPVEGLLVFAKTQKAAGNLTKQLASEALQKTYLALVCGCPPAKEGELIDFLRKDGDRAAVVTGSEKDFPDAKRATLSYRVLSEGEADGKKVTLLEVRIGTGRFHQIRAQLSHAGHPIVGDKKYGNENSDSLAKCLNCKVVALCANRLELRHPSTGKKMSWECVPAWRDSLC